MHCIPLLQNECRCFDMHSGVSYRFRGDVGVLRSLTDTHYETKLELQPVL